jgi:hypothetical protein
MAFTNFARILLVVPVVAIVACGSSNGSTAGTGGEQTTGSTTTTSSSGMGGTATGSTTTTTGTGATGGATATSSTTGTTTTTSTTSATTTGSTTSTTSTTSSTTTTSSSGGMPGACTDAADEMVNMTTVGNDASTCVESNCLGDYITSNFSGLTTCVASCLQTKDNLTAGCAACWGAVVSCGAQHCASECSGGDSTACNTCTDQFCTPAFNTCAGM